jgi:hypothetical protein
MLSPPSYPPLSTPSPSLNSLFGGLADSQDSVLTDSTQVPDTWLGLRYSPSCAIFVPLEPTVGLRVTNVSFTVRLMLTRLIVLE